MLTFLSPLREMVQAGLPPVVPLLWTPSLSPILLYALFLILPLNLLLIFFFVIQGAVTYSFTTTDLKAYYIATYTDAVLESIISSLVYQISPIPAINVSISYSYVFHTFIIINIGY